MKMTPASAFSSRARFFAALAALLVLAGCATGPGANPRDPFEPFNRQMMLVNDSIDVAVRVGASPALNLIARKIAPVSIIVCASPDYLARRGFPKTPGDLAGHEVLAYSLLASGDTWNFRNGEGVEQAVRTDPSVHANNGDLLRELAVAGGGIIASPDFIVAKDLARGALVPLLQDWPMAESHVFAVYLSRKFLSPKVRVFIDYLVETAGPM